MLDPNYMLHISEPAEDIAEQLHNSIIKRIIDRMMLRIGRGEDYLLTATDKWQIETLQEAGILLEDIQAEIARKTRLQEQEIKEAMEEAGVKAIEYDNEVYESVGLSPKPLEQSPNLIRIMQRNYLATMGEWNNFTRTIAEASQQAFINSCDIAYNHVLAGSLSYTEAVKEVVNSIVSTGVEVIYASGHKDTIETATLRCVRTGVSQASSQIGLARMDEMGVDKVLISSHLGARPTHQVWQGKVFTKEQLYSTDEGMPAYGTVTGLCGANCRHNISPYIEGMSNPFEHFDSKENLEMYEKEQRQRLLERRIRDTKREVLGLKESMDKCQDEFTKSELERMYMRKSALLSKQNQAYTDYCETNSMKKLNDRISIARWDRKQAAAARGAAKKWENAHGGSAVKNTIENKNIIGFNKAKSIDEVQERISNASGGAKVDFKNMDVRVANDYLQGIEEFYDEYPKLKGYIDSFDTKRGNIATSAEFEIAWNMDSAYFKPKANVHFANRSYEDYLNDIKENIESGFKYEGSSGITTAKHELVHALQSKMYYIEKDLWKDGDFVEQNIFSFKESKYNYISDSNKIINKAIKNVYGKEPYSEKIKYLGDYAKQDRDEMVAQAISYEMSGRTHPFSAEVKRIFDEKYEKIFGVKPKSKK